MLTAKEALALTVESTLPTTMDEIEKNIRLAAAEGKRSIKVRDYGFSDGSCYGPEQGWSSHQKEIIRQLRLAGYNAAVVVEERQFVDLWLEVSW